MPRFELEKLLDAPTIDVATTCKVIPCGRSTCYEMIRSGEIQTIRVGRNIRVLVNPLRRKLGLTTDAA